jgi:superfamily I DNA/RNA helicase
LLKQTGRIQFLTGHKAKGLEFETVYHLNPYLCKDNEQDLNLRYVIQTRSYNRYYEIRSDRIDWKKEVSKTIRDS